MRKGSLLFVLAVLLLTSSLFAQTPPLLEQLPSDGLRYEDLRTLNREEVKAIWSTLSPNVRQEIWTAHLNTFLAEHPELSDDQRDVVYQGLGLVASGIFNIDRADERYQIAVDSPIRRLFTRAKAVMAPELVSEAFMRLSDNPRQPASGRLKVVANIVDCECSTQETVCEDFGAECRGGLHTCILVPSYNCGPFFNWACDGLCQF